MAQAFRWRRMLDKGSYGTIDDLAAAEKINSSCVSRLLRLTLLAPAIVEATLDGLQPDGMTAPALVEPFPMEWERKPQSLSACNPSIRRPIFKTDRIDHEAGAGEWEFV